MNPPEISIVAPIFNEEALVDELVTRVLTAGRGLQVPFEFVVVNDGSRDSTLARLIVLSAEHPELRVINLMRNFGHMSALTAGIEVAKGQGVIVMDGDLQDPPEMIPAFYKAWKDGADVVYGLRTERRENLLKRTAIAAFYWLLDKLSDTAIPKQVGTFGLMDRKIVDLINQMPERHRYFAGLRAWVGGKQTFVPYNRPDRLKGNSTVGVRGLFNLARTALISFSKAPLRLASLFSLSSGMILFLVGIYAIIEKLFTNKAIPGWATYTTLIGMMGFAQSLILAILSEYMAVLFDEIKFRPLFLIREEFANGKKS